MAKINIVFDTIDKTASVDVDGSKITSLDSLSLYRKSYENDDSEQFELSMGIRTGKKDGMRIQTYVSANKK